MDESNPVFAHQAQAVEALTSHFRSITVLTGRIGSFKTNSNIQVVCSGWVPGQKFRNLYRYYHLIIPYLLKRDTQIFSHMTEVQSALIAPITKLLGIRHYLWYAHTSKSISLRWCHFWVSGIITSTSGSCPIKDSKVYAVGQGVDSSRFLPLNSTIDFRKIRFVHFGRFDPSKNIGEILETCDSIRRSGRNITFTQIGLPSVDIYEKEASQIREIFKDFHWVSFLPSILRENIPNEMKEYSAFIHAYRGSLDKTLIEATLLTLPVITVNQEYLKIFGSWSGKQNPSLLEECGFFLNSDSAHIAKVLKWRREIAVQNHSLSHWARAVADFFE